MSQHVRSLGRRLCDLVTAGRVDALAARVTKLWATRLDGNTDSIVLGRYELDRVLGHGTYGVVFSGFDRLLERDVALKVFRCGSEPEILREARTLARLDHPNVVSVLDVGSVDGLSYLVTALVDGWTIGQRARMGLDLRGVVELFVQAGRGLAAAHRACIVHGDVKPANILVGRDGRVRVADFGMARMLGWRERGELPPGGTRRYGAPEIHAGVTPDEKSDQFAFCVALWEVLHGRPWPGESEPRRCTDASTPLERVVRQGLSIRPEDRHASVDALLDLLDQHAAPQPWRRAS